MDEICDVAQGQRVSIPAALGSSQYCQRRRGGGGDREGAREILLSLKCPGKEKKTIFRRRKGTEWKGKGSKGKEKEQQSSRWFLGK